MAIFSKLFPGNESKKSMRQNRKIKIAIPFVPRYFSYCMREVHQTKTKQKQPYL